MTINEEIFNCLNLKALSTNQKEAVFSKQTPILVSASAGSGKTFVLSTRVVLKLLNENIKPSELLVVTFAKKAANEMFDRIQNKMEDLAKKFPDDENLKEKVLALSSKNITTIDSFCYNVLKDNFELLNLSPNFKICTEAELIKIKEKILDDIFEEHYKLEKFEFKNFCDYFKIDSDQKLKEAILKIYEKAKSQPFPKEYIKNLELPYKNPKKLDETDFSKQVKDGIYLKIKNAELLLENSLSQMDDPQIKKSYEPVVVQMITELSNIASELKTVKYSQIEDILKKFKFKSMPKYNKKTNPFDRDLAEEIKSKFLNPAKRITSSLENFLTTEEEYVEISKKQLPIVTKLIDLTLKFYEKFEQEKNNLNVLEFSDLLTKVLELTLMPKNSDENEIILTDFGKELQKKFKEILVDEFQDVNPAQNLLFRAISNNGNNLFMVGDLKQSIYGFRKASPEIFLNYENTLKKTNAKGKLITLNKNFRSRKEVTNSINFLFAQLMSENFGGLNYKNNHELISSAKFEEGENFETELHILKNETKLTNTEFESNHVASTIKLMLEKKFKVSDKNGNLRPCEPGDFAIISRSDKNISASICSELENLNIPFSQSNTANWLNSYEISITISILKLIDNPSLDLSLCALALSPIFNFSEDELANLRLENQDKPLYLSFKTSTNKKCEKLINLIEILRKKSANLKLSNLVETIYDNDLFKLLIFNPHANKNTLTNLNLLKQYAKQHENLSNYNTSSFLQNLKHIKEKNLSTEPENLKTSKTNSVKILTIHKSKGLEFPIVIIPFTAKNFNEKDYNQPILISSKFGLALKNSNKETLNRQNTLQFNAAMFLEKNLMKAEELRLLYVATTRAKEKLILTALDNNQQFKLPIGNEGETFSATHCLNKTNFYGWILSSFLRHKNSHFLNKKIDLNQKHFDCNPTIETKFEKPKQEKPKNPQKNSNKPLIEQIKNNIEINQNDSLLEKIPAKLSVTEFAKQNKTNFTIKIPKFNATTSASEIGTSTHNFLQYANFENAQKNIEQEIENLVKNEFLTTKQAKLLNISKLKNFFNSKTYKLIQSANKIEREKSFIFQLPANQLFKSAQPNLEITIQGIIDCVIEKNNELTIIDYKTDRTSTTKLKTLYEKQLSIYKQAIEHLKNKPVKLCILYSLHLNLEIEL